MNSSQSKGEKREGDPIEVIEIDRKRPCSANDSGASDTGEAQDENRRMSRRKKGRVSLSFVSVNLF